MHHDSHPCNYFLCVVFLMVEILISTWSANISIPKNFGWHLIWVEERNLVQ